MSVDLIGDDDWVPDACTLPTIEQPLRRVEFDDFFTHDVTGVTRVSPQQLQLELRADPAAAARAAGLAVSETRCCSFFDFELAISHGNVALTVSAEAAHETVLASLLARAEAAMEAAS